MTFPKRRQHPGNEVLARGGDGDESQATVLRIRAGHGCDGRLLEQAEHPAAVGREHGSGRRETQAPPFSLDEADAQLPLERRDYRRDCRLGDEQAPGGLLHRPGLGDGHEAPQLVRRHT